MVPCYFIEYGNEEIAKIQLHHSKNILLYKGV